MQVPRPVLFAAMLAIAGAAAFWLMSAPDLGGIPEGPELAAAPGDAPVEGSPEAPGAPRPGMSRPQVPGGTPFGASPGAVAGSPGTPLDGEEAIEANPDDQAHFAELAGNAMARKMEAIGDAFSDAVKLTSGADATAAKQILDDAFVRMREVETQLANGQVEIGFAFGEIERIRDAAGAELDAVLPESVATSVKGAAGVRSPEEADNAIDWGIPLDDATAEEIFR